MSTTNNSECPTPEELREQAALRFRQNINRDIRYEINIAITEIKRASKEGRLKFKVKDLKQGVHFFVYRWRVRRNPKKFLNEISYAMYEYFINKGYKVMLENSETSSRYLFLIVSWE